MDDALSEHGEAAEAVLLCPICGYDLRGTGGGRCPECGLEVDQRTLRESGFPWAQRRKIGRVRAYLRTVWWLVVHSPNLLTEPARPQDARDGRAFRRVTAGVLVVVLWAAWGWVVAANRGLEFLAIHPPPLGAPPGALRGPGWLADVAVPWSAGATLPWVVPLCLVILAVYLTGAQRPVFRPKQQRQYQRRVEVIAYYPAVPLVLLAPALACCAFLGLMDQARVPMVLQTIVGFAAMLLMLGALGGTLVRVGQWVSRVQHGATVASALAAAELLGLWIVGTVVILGLLPWAVGFFRIVIDSFR
jgi:hypothetical protein